MKNNSRITLKEWGLIKGALRRVFSRSELRKQALIKHKVEHSDPNRPRVKNWGWCNECGEVVPYYTLVADHIAPVVPINKQYVDMTIEELLNNLWCELDNLQAICLHDHKQKSKIENKMRRENKKKSQANTNGVK